MNYNDMPAGPEMDRLIAEKVMGYTVYHYDKDVARNCYYLLMDLDFNPVVSGYRDGEVATEALAWGCTPAFSEDIQAAWAVVEHMLKLEAIAAKQEKRPRVQFHLIYDGDTFDADAKQRHYTSACFGNNQSHQTGYVVGDSVPLVICRAALNVFDKSIKIQHDGEA